MLFSILLLWILLYTHWLPNLETDLKCSRLLINYFFITMIISTWIPPIYVHNRLAVHVGLILILFVTFYFFIQVNEKMIFMTIMLSSSSIAYMLHRFFYFPVDWTSHSFRLLMMVLFVMGAFLAFNQLIERIAYLWSGSIVTHGLIILTNREMLNPIMLGEQTFLDFCGLAMLLLVVIQYGVMPFFTYIRSRL